MRGYDEADQEKKEDKEEDKEVLEDVRAAHDLPERASRARKSLEAGKDEESVWAMRDALALIGQSWRVQRQFRELRGVRHAFMAWRLVHVPASLFLVGLLAIHVFSVWWY